MRLAALAIVSGLMLSSTGCMVEVSRYRAYADRGSLRSRRAAIASFERDHDVVRLRRKPFAVPIRRTPAPGAPLRRLDRGEAVFDQIAPNGDHVVVFSSPFLPAFPHRGPWDHVCDSDIDGPLYRFYRARDGHFVVLRLVPDVRTNEVRTLASTLSIVGPVTLYLAECGDLHRSPRPHGVVLGPGDPARVDVVDAHFDRAVIREPR